MNSYSDALEGAQGTTASFSGAESTLAAMRAARRWLMWREELVPGKKPRKVPYYVDGRRRQGKLDTPEDRAALATYKEAVAGVAGRTEYRLGFALGPDGSGCVWQGVDLDNVDAKGLADLARSLPGYVEVSPSGNGVHCIGYGRGFAALGSNVSGIEAYSSGRFFTFTGKVERDAPLQCVGDFAERTLAPMHRPPERGVLDDLQSALQHLDADNYEEWISVGHALKSLGCAGEELWRSWSATSGKYEADETAAKWESFQPDRTGYQAVFAKAQRNGWTNPGAAPRAKSGNAGPDSRNSSLIKPLTYEWAGDRQPDLTGFWLIKKFLPAEGLALIYGHPGSAKTFFALDMAFAVALGRPWRGKAVQRGLVVYVAAEGANGIRQRVEAFKLANGITERLPMAIIPTPIDMQAANADTNRLAETIRHAAEESGMKPALVIVDTISKTFGAGKENTDDMATYVANCGHIATEFSCCVMPVHHRPKDAESKDPRGHSSLRGGCDTIILTEGTKVRKATVTKQKDGEDGETFAFDLLPVELGVDEDGEVVNSCVVREISASLSPVSDPRGAAYAKLSAGQKITLEALGLAIEDEGQIVPDCIPDRIINRSSVGKVVNIECWRRLFLATSAIDRTGSGQNSDDDAGHMPDRLPDTLRKTFSRHRQSLQTKGFVGVWEQFVWLAH